MVWLMRKAGVAMAALALSCGAAGAEHVVPLFMSASNAQQQGFVRIVNHSDSAGTVRIRAVDDTGHEASALTLTLAAGAVAHFNSKERWEVTILDGFPDQENVQVRPLWPNRHNVDNAFHTNSLSIAVIDDLFVGYYVDPHLDEFTASTYSFNLSHVMPSGARRTSV